MSYNLHRPIRGPPASPRPPPTLWSRVSSLGSSTEGWGDRGIFGFWISLSVSLSFSFLAHIIIHICIIIYYIYVYNYIYILYIYIILYYIILYLHFLILKDDSKLFVHEHNKREVEFANGDFGFIQAIGHSVEAGDSWASV